MPTNKNAMTRYKIIDELLSNRHHNYSLDDITEEINKRMSDLYPNTNGVVRRTIEKDIYYLEYEGPFLVDIERYSVPSYNYEKRKTFMKKCLRYANPSFSIFKKEMTNDEETILREVLSLVGKFDGLPNFEALENLRIGLGAKDEEHQIISFSKNPLENSSLLGEIFTSISERQVIRLHYHTFLNPKDILETDVYPYLLKEYNSRWFLIAASADDKKILTFSLDRINSISPLPSHKYVGYKGNIQERFEDIIGVTYIEDSPIYKIIFWVSEKSKDYVCTKPLHESQRKVSEKCEITLRKSYPALQDGQFFIIECKYNYELIRELMSFGEHLLVIEPQEIKDIITTHINNMRDGYQVISSCDKNL